ncbi:MAG: amidohydrolase [Betaproteobacteria bacterium]|nr:amidohydrolase [Betaproteobacteria bacterium]
MADYKVKKTASSKLREKLDFPVIDTDGHIMEAAFVLPDFIKKVGGAKMAERFISFAKMPRFADNPKIVPWPQFSGENTIDRAAIMLPRLYAKRLEEAGVDFSTIYPTLGFTMQTIPDDELRRVGCRAMNMMYADMFRDVRDKMTPAALIPMNTPEEAIEELEFAVKELGMRALMTANEVSRTPKVIMAEAPHLAGKVREYSPLAIDSPYDYDPFWAKCLELKVVPAGHSMPFVGTHQSPVNYIYNRLGFWMTYGHAAARALFMSGTTQRFPQLNFAFLEGGVWWGVALYNDLVEFWEKRNMEAMLRYHDPAKIDLGLMEEMYQRYGNDYLTAERMIEATKAEMANARTPSGDIPPHVNDWTAVKIDKKQDIKESFVDRFYFGCEADDSLNYTAFNAKANKMGAKLKAMFSSDLGHWDVKDWGGVLEETYEQVERGLMTEEDFRDFVFVNPVTLQTRVNPDFFKGTCVEGAVASYQTKSARAA